MLFSVLRTFGCSGLSKASQLLGFFRKRIHDCLRNAGCLIRSLSVPLWRKAFLSAQVDFNHPDGHLCPDGMVSVSLRKKRIMNNKQSSLDFNEDSQTTSNDTQPLALGEVRTVGNYQVRNFKGFYQSREGKEGAWKFHISGFDSTTTGSAGFCTLILANGGREEVPIDAKDRISVLGAKYGRENWIH